MKRKWQSLSALTVASIKMYFRNLSAVFFTLFIPVVLVVVFGFLGGGGSVSLKIGITNNSSSQLSQQFIDQLGKVDAFKIEQGSLDTERDKLGKGKIDLQLIIPKGFGQTANGRLLPATIYAYYNKSRPQTGQTANLILSQIISGINSGINHTPQVVQLNAQGVTTNDLTAIDYILPGIIALSIMQLGIFSVSFAFISYKTTGMLRRLQAAPIHPTQFLVAQGITRLIIGILQVCLLIFLGIAFFHMHLIGNLLLLLFFAIIGTLVFLAFGFMVAGAAHDENQAAPLSNIISFPQLFLANIFFPNDSFPHWLKLISDHLPLAYLGDAMRRVANEGAGLVALKGDLIGLLVWGIIASIIAIRVFSWE